jgi:hypothetical protein
MTNTKKISFALVFAGSIALSAIWIASTKNVFGEAPSGLPSGHASTSQIAVTVGTLSIPVASSTVPTPEIPSGCSSRVVATASTSVNIGIGNMVPSGSLGYFLAASSTKEFDSGIYGCGALKIFPFATGAITVTDNN